MYRTVQTGPNNQPGGWKDGLVRLSYQLLGGIPPNTAASDDGGYHLAATLMSAVGEVVYLDSEDLIDAVTAVSGSGPAYVFLLIEAMAQCGGFLVMSLMELPETKLVYFSSIDKARFRRPVLPGDQVIFEANMLKFRRNTCKMSAVARVDGQVVCEAELLAAVVDR